VAVGAKVIGYLPGYLSEEHYGSGARFLLLDFLPIGAGPVAALAVLIGLASVVYIVRRQLDYWSATALVYAVAVIVAAPVQPWYAVGLAALGVMAEMPALALPALLAEGYYAAVILDDPHQVAVGRICYGAAAVALMVILGRRGRGRSRRGLENEPWARQKWRSSAAAASTNY
jgi:hypothetical protein